MSMIDTLHPVDPEGRRHYDGILDTGKSMAAGTSLGVAVIARNCEQSIGRTMGVVNELSRYFLSTEFIIYTNDCRDNTTQVIADTPLDEDIAFVHVDEELGHPDLSGSRLVTRTVNLAHCRNEAKSYLTGQPEAVLVLDADLLEVTVDRLLAGYGEMVELRYDAMAAQNLVRAPAFEKDRMISYDAFAFRPAWADLTNYMIEKSFHYDVRPAGVPAYRVRSAFGGACWYDGEVYFDARKYDGEHGCEHVEFNRGLLIGVSPSMSLIGFIH